MKMNMNTNPECTFCAPTIVIDKVNLRLDDAVCLSAENTLAAQIMLSPIAFFLYMYFVLVKNGETFQFLSTHFCEATGLTHDMYLAACDELLHYEYLTTTSALDTLRFHDRPFNLPWLNQTSPIDQDYRDESEW